MQRYSLFFVIKLILQSTPFYIWILLLFLIKKGMKSSEEAPINITKSLIVPTVFIIWGLDSICRSSENIIILFINLICYFLFMVGGSRVGFLLYQKYQRCFKVDSVVYKSKCYLPFIIILINFTMKYILNVFSSVLPWIKSFIGFHILYSGLSGISSGLFIGGIIYMYLESKKLN